MVRNTSLFALVLILSFIGFSSKPALAQAAQAEEKGKAEPAKKSYEIVVKESKPKPDEPKGKYIVGDPIPINALGADLKSFDLNICAGASDQAKCVKLNEHPNLKSILFLKATRESEQSVTLPGTLPVTIPVNISVKVLAGAAYVYPYDATAKGVKILPRSAGKLVLEATAVPAVGTSPSRMTLYVDGGDGSTQSACARVFPPAVHEPPPVIEASMIVRLIGAPQPYVLEALTKDTILIYSTRPPGGDADKVRKKILQDIARHIRELSKYRPAELGFKPAAEFSVDLYVPHFSALGGLQSIAAQASSKNNSKLTVTSVGDDKIRVTSQSKPDCEAWMAFLTDLRALVWPGGPEPLTARLFYQDAAEVSKALNPSGTPPKPGTTASALGKDILVFSDADDSIVAKKRILAQLDLPRPEMIVNAWVMQNSSKDPKVVTEFSDIVQWTVRSFNNQLEKSVSAGWGRLKQRITDPNFFETSFHDYIARRYVGELQYGALPSSVDEGAQEILNLRSTTKLTNHERGILQACSPNEYCLGYNAIFHPLKPRLTDLLITVIAARNPPDEIKRAIEAMEWRPQTGCQGDSSHQDYCRKMLSLLRLSDEAVSSPDQQPDCRTRDLAEIHRSAKYGAAPPLFLRCFKEKAIGVFTDGQGANANDNPARRSQLGLLRRAIADFLFHYKLSQQYPHEFAPYELSQSADTLNTVLVPFIEGFNQDLEAYQEFLKAEVRYRVDRLARARHWHVYPEQRSFINNSTVSVRTISGTPTGVSATSQSFLDASKAPGLSDLVTNITGENPPKGENGTPTGILGNMSFNQAQLLLGALKSYQSSTVEIGRQLSLDFTPRSLSTASSAEIEVTLKANETAPPTYYGGTKGGQQADVSRIAVHDTKTRVRIDSIKLFEISSFTAELQKSRSRFPLIPPFVELPYVGTLFGIPLPPAKVYHTSTAVLSAIVVPTASDLAWGLAFIQDRILDSTCDRCTENDRADSTKQIQRARKAISLRDLGDRPVRSFHMKKVLCFAANAAPAVVQVCGRQTFDDVLHEP